MKIFKLSLMSLGLSIALFASENLSLTQQHEESLVRGIIPSTKVLKVERAQIDGFYKAYLENGNILYINPFNRAIFVGEFYTAGGINITANDREKWQLEQSKEDLKSLNAKELIKDSKKVVYGKGNKDYEFVIFTDPECPFCNRLEEWLEQQNASVWINFFPLSFHPNAEKWSLEILSAKDFKQAMHITRTTQKDQNIKITQKARDTLKKMQEKSAKLQIQGTPMIYVLDKAKNIVVEQIEGADIARFSKYIKEETK